PSLSLDRPGLIAFPTGYPQRVSSSTVRHSPRARGIGAMILSGMTSFADDAAPIMLRLHEPAELLSFIPYRFGFHPEESFVMVSVRGPQPELGFCARVDLGDWADPEAAAQIVTSLADQLSLENAR